MSDILHFLDDVYSIKQGCLLRAGKGLTMIIQEKRTVYPRTNRKIGECSEGPPDYSDLSSYCLFFFNVFRCPEIGAGNLHYSDVRIVIFFLIFYYVNFQICRKVRRFYSEHPYSDS